MVALDKKVARGLRVFDREDLCSNPGRPNCSNQDRMYYFDLENPDLSNPHRTLLGPF